MTVHSVPSSPSSEPGRGDLPATGQGPTAAAISREIVQLLRERSGRGPTKARAQILDDLVLVTLSDCLTKFERLLVESGEQELVDQLRDRVHKGMRAQAIAIVEERTGRVVEAYLSDQNLAPDFAVRDFAVLAFVLGSPTPLQIA